MGIILYELVGADEARPFSPHCWKVRMALRHKQLDFSTEPVTFTGIAEIENGLSKTLPVLRDCDMVIVDSFRIADHLEAKYPDAPSLFGGPVGRQYAKFMERWSFQTIHSAVGRFAILEIHEMLDLPSKEYFRRSREERFGQLLEEVARGRETAVPQFLASLEPLREALANGPFLGGDEPLFVDYVVFGAMQWLRVVSTFNVLPSADPVALWFDRCLNLHQRDAQRVPAAADL